MQMYIHPKDTQDECQDKSFLYHSYLFCHLIYLSCYSISMQRVELQQPLAWRWYTDTLWLWVWIYFSIIWIGAKFTTETQFTEQNVLRWAPNDVLGCLYFRRVHLLRWRHWSVFMHTDSQRSHAALRGRAIYCLSLFQASLHNTACT